MKEVNLILEDDEIFLLRGQVRMLQLFVPDMAEGGGEELINSFSKKILEATGNIDSDYRKEIGKMQRAMRKIKATPFYPLLLSTMQTLQTMMVQEIQKEDDTPPPLTPQPNPDQ